MIKNHISKNLFSVIVTYNPDYDTLNKIIKSLIRQNCKIIIVDNASKDQKKLNDIKNNYQVEIINLSTNSGIASAQNTGIRYAEELGADYVLLLDHDSIPDDTMVACLTDGFQALQKKFPDIGAVGSAAYDRRTGLPYKALRASRLTIRKIIPSEHDHYIETDFLISSGTLAPIATFKKCGYLNDSYFIDMVDTEWCFRAQSHGLRLFVIPKAHLQHALGDEVIRIWFGGWRDVCIHSPLRDYYLFRNVIRMLLTTKMKFPWHLAYILRLPTWFVFFAIFAPQRRYRVKMILKGIMDGFQKRGGPLQTNN